VPGEETYILITGQHTSQRWRHSSNEIGHYQRTYSMFGLVSNGMGDHLQTGKPPR